MPIFRELTEIRVPAPPPSEDPNLTQWQGNVADALNKLPNLSVFSFTSPESNVTAQAPTLGFNITGSDVSVLWVKQSGSGDTGWAALG